MSPSVRRLVLVSGCPRSGTTPVGSFLASADGCSELYEPLNIYSGDRRINRYFELPGVSVDTSTAADIVDDVVALRSPLRLGIFPEDGPLRRVGKLVVGGRTRRSYRRARVARPATVIWKDPFAVFWLPFILSRFADARAVITYRSAPAVAASFKRLQWSFDARGLVDRLEMAGYSPDAEIVRFSNRVPLENPAMAGALLWAIIYDWVLRYGKAAILVDSGRLTSNPDYFLALAQTLRLSGARVLDADTGERYRGTDFGGSVHSTRRDMSRVNDYWTRVLDRSETEAITHGLAAVGERLADAAWSSAG